jgi:hypothetical protein
MRLWITVFLAAPALWAGHTLTAEHQKILTAWIAANPQYRAAADADCSCEMDIREMRRGYGDPQFAVPDYRPYQATGDFNEDGRIDFAVVLINNTNTADWAIAVFNAPFAGAKPAFLRRGLQKDGLALFYFAAPRPKPWRLCFGAFQSECEVLEPQRGGYRVIP